MTEILLLRHGQSEGNELGRFGGQGPTPLTQRGRAQAEATARLLAAEGLTAIFSSDLVRAIQTAEPICRATGIAMVRTPALRERSVGLMTGLSFDEAKARFPEAWAAMMAREPSARPPEGETAAEAAARAGALVAEVVERFAHGRTLLVSHAATLNLVLLELLGMPHATHGRRVHFRTDNCGLHRLRRSPDGLWTVRALNETAHLAELTRAAIDEA